MYELTLPAGCSTSLLCGADTVSRAASSHARFTEKRQEIMGHGVQIKSAKVHAFGHGALTITDMEI